MNAADRPWPLLLDPAELAERLHEDGLRIVDLSPGELFAQHHVPGSVHLPYGEIVDSAPPVGGLLPPPETVASVLASAGIDNGSHVVALDAEGGGAAGRLIWTLEALGHTRVSLLDGGLHAWVKEGFPCESGPGTAPADGDFAPRLRTPGNSIDAERIMARLDEAGFRTLDARSAGEYAGATVRAARAGHIPGARHYEWTRAMDPERNLRLRPLEAVRDELAALGVTPDCEVAVYCHTHHRSAFSYALLRILGFPAAYGYPGSWSDWGNRQDTPVETGEPPTAG